LPAPERVSGKRRYSAIVLRQLAIIDSAQRVGFTLDEIRELLGSRDRATLERLRLLAERKLPEVDALIERATAVRGLLQACSACDCGSIDVCEMFDDNRSPLLDHSAGAVASRLAVLREDVVQAAPR